MAGAEDVINSGLRRRGRDRTKFCDASGDVTFTGKGVTQFYFVNAPDAYVREGDYRNEANAPRATVLITPSERCPECHQLMIRTEEFFYGSDDIPGISYRPVDEIVWTGN
jgi:hypothetical protein